MADMHYRVEAKTAGTRLTALYPVVAEGSTYLEVLMEAERQLHQDDLPLRQLFARYRKQYVSALGRRLVPQLGVQLVGGPQERIDIRPLQPA